ncbi:hypothetical protein PT7_P074 (plasmid) [Pusillimonas sp. T7-7]|uniref:recombination protein NinB n=1 Tax=Pusillimonas sp. (strain T7-7) TaxID=1007105 RepID=UPI0002084BD7|nr:recombination protein NinB [Pusillimonas sp. T7-7]AEC22310.1 hypothetical protein PT7_P074 [Pusillimonas sp. T7-7]
MEKQVFNLVSPLVRRNAAHAIANVPDGYRCELRPRTRTLDQNSLLWSCLNDLARQVEWPINGKQERLSPHDWKDIMTASLWQENRVAMGVRGGFVMLGRRTSTMSVRAMTELVDFIHAFGDDHGVQWSPTSLGRDL